MTYINYQQNFETLAQRILPGRYDFEKFQGHYLCQQTAFAYLMYTAGFADGLETEQNRTINVKE